VVLLVVVFVVLKYLGFWGYLISTSRLGLATMLKTHQSECFDH
jgi:hypothetical protein